MFIRPLDLKKLWGIKPTLLVHVGAHKAEELESYKSAAWEKIFWIEAQPLLAEALRKKINFPSVVIEAAIWDERSDEMDMFITNNSESSSLLPMFKHLDVYPDIKTEKVIKVKPVRLDDLLEKEANIEMLNVDVQGAELRVLKSLGERIREVKWIYLEVNEIELYKGLSLVRDIDTYLSQSNFLRVETRWWKNDGWGDALYVRADLAEFGSYLLKVKRIWKRVNWAFYQRALIIWHLINC